MDFLVHHMLRTSALRFPEKEALVCGEVSQTYENVENQAAGLAYGLRRAGLLRGDRVGIYLDPSTSQVLSIFGISSAGGVFVPVNGILFPEQVVHIINDCKMKGLITNRTKLASLMPYLKGLESLKFIVVEGDVQIPDIPFSVYSLEEQCQMYPLPDWQEVGNEKDLAAILYTSGSTGKPKGVMLTHEQIMAGSEIVSDYLGITSSDRILGILPLSFDAGLNQLMTAFQQGGTFVIMSFIFAREIVQALLEKRITGMGGVPTLWSLLVQPNSTLQNHTFPHLRYITNTGGRMPQSVLATLRCALPTTKIFLMYGLTEAFRSTYLPPEELDKRPTSIGKAIPRTEILIVNDQGRLCRPGEIGELVHRGPTVSLGYWGQPELTARVLRPHPFLPSEVGNHERVCYSGDLAWMDEQGFIYFVGRRDNMIKSSGFRVSPTEVEEILFQSGKVREAAVIGIPDEILGQAIKAFVVPRDGELLDAGMLIAFCAEKIPRYMVPKEIEVLEGLPKTPSGKIDYPALRRKEGLT